MPGIPAFNLFETFVYSELCVPQCSACHGPEGRGNAEIPAIANQHADYLRKQVEIFQNTDLRPRGEAMKQITHQLTKEEIIAVTEYLASTKFY